MKPQTRFSIRHSYPPVWIWAIAIIPRLLILSPIFLGAIPPLKGDALGYWVLAQNLIHSSVFSSSSTFPYMPETFRTPGYPAFLSVFALFFRTPAIPVAIAQCAIGAWTVVIAWRWLQEWAGPKGASLGAVVLALDPVILFHTPLLLSETLCNLCLTASLVWTWKVSPPKGKEPMESLGAPSIAGILWSITTMIRPVFLYLPFLLSLLWFGRKKTWAIFLIAAYLLPAVWITRNWKATGYASFSSVGQISLLRYPAAGIKSLQSGRPMTEWDQELCAQVDRQHPSGYSNEAEQGSAYAEAAMPILKEHPFLLLKYCLHGSAKVLGGTGMEMLLEWGGVEIAPSANQVSRPDVTGWGTLNLLKRHFWLLPLQLAYGFGLVALYLLAIAGLQKLWKSGQRARAAVLAGTAAYLLAMSSSQGYYRYRIPLMPPLSAAAAAAVP